MSELRQLYESYYALLWNDFLDRIYSINVEGCPEPHLPVYGEYYENWNYKIAFVGIDTIGNYSMGRYNNVNGYSEIIGSWKQENFDNLKYLEWAQRYNFWRFIFKFLSKFYNVDIEKLKKGEGEDIQKILKSFIWANTMSIERFNITAEGKAVIKDNWQRVKDASRVFDKAENILNVFKPDIIILLNWTMVDNWLPEKIGEPEKHLTLPLWYYLIESSSTVLYWTMHPRGLRHRRFDPLIAEIFKSIKSKNVFPSFPGENVFN